MRMSMNAMQGIQNMRQSLNMAQNMRTSMNMGNNMGNNFLRNSKEKSFLPVSDQKVKNRVFVEVIAQKACVKNQKLKPNFKDIKHSY